MVLDSSCLSKCPVLEKTWGFQSEGLQFSELVQKRKGVKRDNVKPLTVMDALLPPTPDRNVFDPFVPGPEEMALAPRKKRQEDSHIPRVVCRLHFDSAQSFDRDSKRFFLEKMDSLVMHTNSAKQIDSSSQLSQLDLSKGCKGLPSLPTLSWNLTS